MGLGPKFQVALIFLFFEPSESTAPLFPPPGHAGSDGGGPSSIWASSVPNGGIFASITSDNWNFRGNVTKFCQLFG